jgi:phospholipase/carboxylesterase
MNHIIFLHGVGSSGAAMRPLANGFGAPAHFPDGVQPFDMGAGHQWFSVQGVTEQNRAARVAAALPAFVERLSACGPLQDAVLVGFSQGAIMALHAAATGLPLAGVIAVAGRLAGPVLARADWPPITLLHGDADPVIPLSLAMATQGWLHEAGSDATLMQVAGLGHTIDARMLDLIQISLARSQ